MSIPEMQACLARLYVDDCFRKLFYLDPAETVRDYVLNSEEAAALKGIDRRMLDFFAGSLKNKRKDRLERAYPLLFKVGGAAVERCYRRYYQLHLADPHWLGYQDIVDFGLFAEESIAGLEDVPAYAADVSRYERLCYLTSYGPSEHDTEAAVSEAEPFGLDDYLRQSKGIRLEIFEFDIPALEETLPSTATDGNQVDLTPGDYYLLFRPPSLAYDSKVMRVNHATKALMDRCNGSRRISQIISDLEQHYGATDLQATLFAAIRRLLSAGALKIARP